MATIMIVDDALFVRYKCRKMLAQNGYEVIEAATGLEAVARYKETRADAVLMDINMPDMDGVQALKELLNFDPGAKVAMFTAMKHKSIVMECLKIGAKDFIVKPFDADQLLLTLNRILA